MLSLSDTSAQRKLLADVRPQYVAVATRASEVLPTGTPVRVRNALGSWAGGFVVVSVDRAGYLLRRVSDGALIPTPIGRSEVKKG